MIIIDAFIVFFGSSFNTKIAFFSPAARTKQGFSSVLVAHKCKSTPFEAYHTHPINYFLFSSHILQKG